MLGKLLCLPVCWWIVSNRHPVTEKNNCCRPEDTFLRISCASCFEVKKCDRYLRGHSFTCHILPTWQKPVLMPHSLCWHVVLKRSCSFWLQSIVRASWHITFVKDLGWGPKLWVTELTVHRRCFPVFGNINCSHKNVSIAKWIFHFHVPYFHMCISVEGVISPMYADLQRLHWPLKLLQHQVEGICWWISGLWYAPSLNTEASVQLVTPCCWACFRPCFGIGSPVPQISPGFCLTHFCLQELIPSLLQLWHPFLLDNPVPCGVIFHLPVYKRILLLIIQNFLNVILLWKQWGKNLALVAHTEQRLPECEQCTMRHLQHTSKCCANGSHAAELLF